MYIRHVLLHSNLNFVLDMHWSHSQINMHAMHQQVEGRGVQVVPPPALDFQNPHRVPAVRPPALGPQNPHRVQVAYPPPVHGLQNPRILHRQLVRGLPDLEAAGLNRVAAAGSSTRCSMD